MYRKLFSIVFVVIFLTILALPAVAVIMDDSDVYAELVLDSDEEEERFEERIEEDFFHDSYTFKSILVARYTTGSIKKTPILKIDSFYDTPHLGIMLPPPKNRS